MQDSSELVKESEDHLASIDADLTNHQKCSKSIASLRKRIENILKEERRNYTLSNFTNNPLYDISNTESNPESIEEGSETNSVKFNRQMLWNLEQKLSNIL